MNGLCKGQWNVVWTTVCKTVHPLLSDRFLSCLVCLWRWCILWTNGWMGQDPTWYGGRPRPRRHCIRWRPKEAQQPVLVCKCLQFCEMMVLHIHHKYNDHVTYMNKFMGHVYKKKSAAVKKNQRRRTIDPYNSGFVWHRVSSEQWVTRFSPSASTNAPSSVVNCSVDTSSNKWCCCFDASCLIESFCHLVSQWPKRNFVWICLLLALWHNSR